MAELNDIQRLYQDYIADVRRLERERRLGDGLLGMGRRSSDDPCHDRFVHDLEACLEEIAAEHLPAEQVWAVLAYIYQAPAENKKNQTVYWMLLAVHGLTLNLIGQITPAQAQELWEKYKTDYPRWEQLPVQKQAFAALNAARKK